MSHPYASELATGLAAVRAAARICQTVQATITPEALEKKDLSPVTPSASRFRQTPSSRKRIRKSCINPKMPDFLSRSPA